MILLRTILLVAALGASPLRAADVAYPPGSRIGLAPPDGMVASKSFFGFEDPPNHAAIILAALPGGAYADLDRTLTAETLKRQGVALEKREAMELSTGHAFLVIGRQEIDNEKLRKWILVAASPTLTAIVTAQIPDAARTLYPDAAVRAALTSLAVRADVPVEEQLGLLPFKIGELAGFRVAGVIPGRAVILSDTAATAPVAPAASTDSHIFVAVAPGAPAQATDRMAFARDVFATVPNLKEVRFTVSEPLRIGGQQGYQIIADAKDAASGTPLTVVQWLRFGSGAHLQMVGIARADSWKDAYPRFRSVRDGIEPR
ncbi:MAG TPA: hypothetical protein VGF60_08435 [Xanthobacteraceae bacterium]|jgi:hypothetical protein